jgi:hypothetical protein
MLGFRNQRLSVPPAAAAPVREAGMSKPQEFCNDPKAFMETHVVYVIVPKETEGTVDVTIDERPNSIVTNNPNAGVFRLRLARKTDPVSIPAYFCPYEQNDIKGTMLGNRALWMFTPTMDGCTLGVGSQGTGGDGAVRVCHVNMARSGTAIESLGIDVGRAQQAKLQRNVALSDVGMDGTVIEPMTYMTEGTTPYALKATTFGTHPLNRPWSFYTLRYRYAGNSFFHGGVHPHP